jgi:hypothetical protein
MPNQQNYPEGTDCVWLGVDQAGAVAAFVTAGEGEIPTALLTGAVVDILQIEAMLLDLPVVGKAVMHMDLPRADDYLAMASRGLYVYDWSRNQYTRFATPTVAIQHSVLTETLQVAADLAVFTSVDFPKRTSLSINPMIEAVQLRML